MYHKNKLKYVEDADLYFSCIKGSGVYCWNRGMDNDPTDVSGGRQCPVFLNVETQEEFLVKKIYWDKYLNKYKDAVKNPTLLDNVFWPVDVVCLNDEEVTDTYAENRFGLVIGQDSHREGKHVMLFPCRDYGVSKSVRDELKEIDKLNWKERRVQTVILQILQAYKELNDKGYLNLDMDFSHFYIRDDRKILFAYSNLILETKGEDEAGPKLLKGEFPVEFAQPALVQEIVTHADIDMQNYSLAAMLFYLMIGRFAYDGPLMAGITDTNEVEHEHKFEVYHKNPVFIFDEKDTANHLGEFAADQRVIALWEELPEQIRKMFQRTLAQKNALRTQRQTNPTPEEWLACLKEAKWN